MIKLNVPLRIGIFYDGNYLLHASNYYNYFHPQHRRLSIGGLHSFIKKRVTAEEGCEGKRCQIVEAHYFRGRISAAEALQRGNQLYNDRVFEDILMAEGIQTHYLPLRNFAGKKEERGIDVWLSLEALEFALSGKLDVVVLIVSDTNYAPLLRKLCSHGTRVMLLSWEFDYFNDDGAKVVTKTSHELLQLATYPVFMHEDIEKGLEGMDPDTLALFVENESPKDDEVKARNAASREKSEILSIKNGYGFVKYANNNLYFHMMDVIGDFSELAPGDTVEFVIDKNAQNNDIAKHVKKL